VPLVLLGIAAIERYDDGDDPAAGVSVPQAAAQRSLMPVAAPEGSLSSTWFCAGGTASSDGVADHTIVVANPTDDAVTATVTIYVGTFDSDPNAEAVGAQTPVTQSLEVPAEARSALRLRDVLPAARGGTVCLGAGRGARRRHRRRASGQRRVRRRHVTVRLRRLAALVLRRREHQP
jgi:hypothetical protein